MGGVGIFMILVWIGAICLSIWIILVSKRVLFVLKVIGTLGGLFVLAVGLLELENVWLTSWELLFPRPLSFPLSLIEFFGVFVAVFMFFAVITWAICGFWNLWQLKRLFKRTPSKTK